MSVVPVGKEITDETTGDKLTKTSIGKDVKALNEKSKRT